MTLRKRPPILAVAALAVLTALALVAVPASADPGASSSAWIVILKAPRKGQAEPRRLGRVKHVFRHALTGYAATLTPAELAAVRADWATAVVVPDRVVKLSDPIGTSVQAQPAQVTPTGIDRIDVERFGGGLPVPRVRVAVIDTGIDSAHPDLAGLVVGGKDCVGDGYGLSDPAGHGTHVSGTIAARYDSQGVFGVLPSAELLAVRVLGASGTGTWSQTICGIEWVTANAAALNIKVANMSLGGAGSDDGSCGNGNADAVHMAICGSVAAGVTYVVGAGNSGVDLAATIPASYDEVITVSALADSDGRPGGAGLPTPSGPDDTFASFSNYATTAADRAHTVGAPGVGILSTWPGGQYANLNGTSMAAPHVTGVVAKRLSFLAGLGMSATPAQMLAYVRRTGEPIGYGHTDPSGRHPEPVVIASGLPPRRAAVQGAGLAQPASQGAHLVIVRCVVRCFAGRS